MIVHSLSLARKANPTARTFFNQIIPQLEKARSDPRKLPKIIEGLTIPGDTAATKAFAERVQTAVVDGFGLGVHDPFIQLKMATDETFAEPATIFDRFGEAKILRPGNHIKPQAAIDFYLNAGIVPPELFEDWLEQTGEWAFTSAKLSDQVARRAVRDVLVKELGAQGIKEAVTEGGKIKRRAVGTMDFDNFMLRVKREGITRLSTSATELIFEQNMSTALHAQRYVAAVNPLHSRFVAAWRYVALIDDRVRDEHASWHNTIHLQSSSFWDSWYPPNDFRCRCIVIFVYKEERLGKQIASGDVKVGTSREARAAFNADTRIAKGSQKVFFPKSPRVKNPTFTTKQGIVYNFDRNVGKLLKTGNIEAIVSGTQR